MEVIHGSPLFRVYLTYLAVEPLKPFGTAALVIVRGVAATAIEGAAPAPVLTRPGRTWVDLDVAERA